MQRYEMFPESASRNFGDGIRAIVIPGYTPPGILGHGIRGPESGCQFSKLLQLFCLEMQSNALIHHLFL